jgi:tetratricopeptide (TPR) repeat protein
MAARSTTVPPEGWRRDRRLSRARISSSFRIRDAFSSWASIAPDGTGERVADEARHQELIEATFDRAEAYERLGDFERALEWLDRAAALGGDLPPAYRSRRALWARATARRSWAAAGDWRNHLGTAGKAAPAPLRTAVEKELERPHE